ncbi:MAG TPA: ATP-dependent zinc protease [Alphaproteobacteria bacterium]|nr:ATP-dependent zinc protease [Alphaproteobacteria bacterium]
MTTTTAKPKASPTKRKRREPMLIGWREWIGLPKLGVQMVKAKIDTGARSSALHAWNIKPFEKNGAQWVAFQLHPMQRDNNVVIECEAPILGERRVRSSSGAIQLRYVIKTVLELGVRRWPIELTLTNRDQMGFRVLLGRTALRRRAIIDPGRSFLSTRRLNQ